MSATRTILIDVQEGGGVPVPQFVELSNALAKSEPGAYVVTIEPLDRARAIEATNRTLAEEHCYIGPAGATRTADEVMAKYRELSALAVSGDNRAEAMLDLFDWLDHDLFAIYDIIDTDKDPVLAWLEREAADARRVLEAERDPGNIEIMRQWVYHHECMVRKRLDELGLLDVDDEPAGGERHE